MSDARISGLNHLTLAVSDLGRSLPFYRDVLGCEIRAEWDTGAYLEAGNLWICLTVDGAARPSVRADYTHYAFTVAPAHWDTLCDRVKRHAPIWKDNASEGASLYFLDPDGHRLELHMGSLATRLAHYRAQPPGRIIID